MTPGLPIGALLGIILGSLWNNAWPGVSLGAFAIIGSAAFLASSMKMPLTAIALIVEFTRIGHDFLIPIALAVAGSICVFSLCTEHNFQPIWRLASVHISTPLSKFVGCMTTWKEQRHRNSLTAPASGNILVNFRVAREVLLIPVTRLTWLTQE